MRPVAMARSRRRRRRSARAQAGSSPAGQSRSVRTASGRAGSGSPTPRSRLPQPPRVVRGAVWICAVAAALAVWSISTGPGGTGGPADGGQADPSTPHGGAASWAPELAVVDALGRPVPGATVHVWDCSETWNAVLRDDPATPDGTLTELASIEDDAWDGLLAHFHSARGIDAREPDLVLQTTGDGTLQTSLPGPGAVLYATHADLGTSGELLLPRPWLRRAARLTIALRPISSVRGRVRDWTRRPVPDATVTYAMAGPRALPPDVFPRLRPVAPTGPSGHFHLHVDSPCGIAFTVTSEGDRHDLSAQHFAWFEAGQEADVTIQLLSPYAVTGTLRTVAGAVITRGEVGLVPVPAPAETSMQRLPDLQRLPDGRFRVDLDGPGAHLLYARGEDLIQRDALRASVSHAEPLAELDVILVPTVSLSGRAVWSDGAPLVRARLTLTPRTALVPEPDADSIVAGLPTSAALTGRTDGDGRFAFDDLSPSLAYDLSCDLGNLIEPARVLSHHVPDGRELALALDRLEPSGTKLKGVVVDASGRPTRSCAIWLYPLAEGEDVTHELFPTRPADGRGWNGSFTLYDILAYTDYLVVARSDDGAYGTATPSRTLPRSETHVRLVLSAPGQLQVTARDASGAVMRGVHFRLQGDTWAGDWPHRPVSRTGRQRVDTRRTDATDGTTTLHGIPPGRCTVTALGEAGSFAPANLLIPEGDTLSLELQITAAAPPGG